MLDAEKKIQAIVNSLPRRGSVRTSPYCADVISMRLRGHTYREIEDWLASKGEEYRIPAGTLNRVFLNTPIAESEFIWITEIESRGGSLELDLSGELKKQIYLQRLRINTLAKREINKRVQIPDYVDKRIQQVFCIPPLY